MHVEAHGRERASHQAIHLVAPAAAPRVHELGEHDGRVEAQRAADMDVEILVGNSDQMRPMQCGERRERRLAGAAVGHASAIASELVVRQWKREHACVASREHAAAHELSNRIRHLLPVARS